MAQVEITVRERVKGVMDRLNVTAIVCTVIVCVTAVILVRPDFARWALGGLGSFAALVLFLLFFF